MKLFSGDRVFLSLALALAVGGFAIFSSAALGLLARDGASVSHEIFMQAGLGLALGVTALLIVRVIPLARFKQFAPWIYAASVLFTVAVFIPGIGKNVNGATRWIDVGFTTIQPAEFLKIGVVLMLAWWLSYAARQFKDVRMGLIPFLAITGLPVVILLLQPNTSTMLLISITGLAMYFVAGAPWRDIAIVILLALVALSIVLVARPYVRERVLTFINPASDPLDSSYQIQQALIAIGSGGFVGRGFGQSVGKFNYLPEPAGDSVFAVYAEETGFVGALILLALFVGLAARGIVIAGESRELFGGLVAFGLSFMLIFQTFINMGAMLGIIPLTGLPLPFVSHGGTALLALLASCGLILNVSVQRKSPIA